jgi:hypothetical protein
MLQRSSTAHFSVMVTLTQAGRSGYTDGLKVSALTKTLSVARRRSVRSWETSVLDDFAELRQAGLNNSLMDEIETLFASRV